MLNSSRETAKANSFRPLIYMNQNRESNVMHFERDAWLRLGGGTMGFVVFYTSIYGVGITLLQKMDYKFQSSTFFPEKEDS